MIAQIINLVAQSRAGLREVWLPSPCLAYNISSCSQVWTFLIRLIYGRILQKQITSEPCTVAKLHSKHHDIACMVCTCPLGHAWHDGCANVSTKSDVVQAKIPSWKTCPLSSPLSATAGRSSASQEPRILLTALALLRLPYFKTLGNRRVVPTCHGLGRKVSRYTLSYDICVTSLGNLLIFPAMVVFPVTTVLAIVLTFRC